MKIIFVLWILVIMAVIGFAAFMAYNDKEGWGWFLFAGMVLAAGFSYKERDTEEKKGG